MSRYFDLPRPRILAHRGLATEAMENSLSAFAAAWAAGARYLETDVHASADGVAMLAHDPDLVRVSGRTDRVGDLPATELAELGLASLSEALTAFPAARFNIDVKDPAAVTPTVDAIRAAAALDRVLVTSFSGRRRRATVRGLPGVATSASAVGVAVALVAGKLGLGPVVRAALHRVQAVQIPERALAMSTVTPRMIRAFHRAGVEVHVWTVDSPARMTELIARGVDGIVTDRADLGILTVSPSTIPENPL